MDDEYFSPEDAYEFIKAIEETNIKQFPEIINLKKKNKRQALDKETLLNEMRLVLYSMLDTRISILREFIPQALISRGINEGIIDYIYGLVDNETDPSVMITRITEMEKTIINDMILQNILRQYPKAADKIVKHYAEKK